MKTDAQNKSFMSGNLTQTAQLESKVNIFLASGTNSSRNVSTQWVGPAPVTWDVLLSFLFVSTTRGHKRAQIQPKQNVPTQHRVKMNYYEVGAWKKLMKKLVLNNFPIYVTDRLLLVVLGFGFFKSYFIWSICHPKKRKKLVSILSTLIISSKITSSMTKKT